MKSTQISQKSDTKSAITFGFKIVSNGLEIPIDLQNVICPGVWIEIGTNYLDNFGMLAINFCSHQKNKQIFMSDFGGAFSLLAIHPNMSQRICTFH